MHHLRFHMIFLLSVWGLCARALPPEKIRFAFVKAVEAISVGTKNPPSADYLGVDYIHTVLSKFSQRLAHLDESKSFQFIEPSVQEALMDILGELYLNKYANRHINAYYFTRTFHSAQYIEQNQGEFHPTALIYSLDFDQFIIEHLLESKMGEKSYSRTQTKGFVSHLLRQGLRFEERYYPPEKISFRMQDTVSLMPLLFDVSSNVIQGLFERKTILVGNQRPSGDFLGNFIPYPLDTKRTKLLADLFYSYLQKPSAISAGFGWPMATPHPSCSQIIAF